MAYAAIVDFNAKKKRYNQLAKPSSFDISELKQAWEKARRYEALSTRANERAYDE